MLVAWPADDHAVVIAIERHDESSDDVYAAILDALGLQVPEDEREKPPCCDEEGLPPADPNVATRHRRCCRPPPSTSPLTSTETSTGRVENG